MADTMQFDLVSPERMLVSGAAKSVLIPGAEGDMVAMPNHEPIITTLRPGVLSVEMDGGTQEFIVTGGFAEISAEGASVLAEVAVAKADATADMINDRIEAEKAAGGDQDATNMRIAQLEALAANL